MDIYFRSRELPTWACPSGASPSEIVRMALLISAKIPSSTPWSSFTLPVSICLGLFQRFHRTLLQHTINTTEEECGEPVLKVADEQFSLNIDWQTSYAITNREFIFMITYAVISGVWVATSVLVISELCKKPFSFYNNSRSTPATLCNRTTKLISGVVYWPWFLSVLAGSILDVVATVYHGIDISHTTVW